MYHPVTAELAVQEQKERVKKAEHKAALLLALAPADVPHAPASRTVAVRGFVGSLFIGLGLWIQGSKTRHAPVVG